MRLSFGSLLLLRWATLGFVAVLVVNIKTENQASAFTTTLHWPVSRKGGVPVVTNHVRSWTAQEREAPPVVVGVLSGLALPKLEDVFDTGNATEAVMREFAKKEAAMQKRRQDAQEKLDNYEATLERLRNRKAEYVAGQQLAEASPTGGGFSETAMRSVVKSFCWRIIAGTVTFITSLQFSHSLMVALKVVGADFFSKSITMFLGERLMNKSQAGRTRGGDNAGRSLVKALIWRIFAVSNTLTMAIFVAKDLSVASKIASTDAVFKTALMFIYERVWARIAWGKEYLIEFSI